MDPAEYETNALVLVSGGDLAPFRYSLYTKAG